LLTDEPGAADRAGTGLVVDRLVARHAAGIADVVLGFPGRRSRVRGRARRGAPGRPGDESEAEQDRGRDTEEIPGEKGGHASLLATGATACSRLPDGWRRLKRSRCWLGGIPTVRRKARRIDSGVPRPLMAQIASRSSDDSSRRRRAVSMRTEVTKRAGVVLTSRVKTRAKLRGLIATRRARLSTDRSSRG